MGRIHANDLAYATDVLQAAAVKASRQGSFTASRSLTEADFAGADTVAIELADHTPHVPTLDDLRKLSDTIRRAHNWRNEGS